MSNFEIIWDIDDWDDGYAIVESETLHKACLDILKNIILNGEKIPSSFYVHNLDNMSFDDMEKDEILTRDLISIMYLSNNMTIECPKEEYYV